MMQFMDKKKIIMLKEQGLSNREVARKTGVDKKRCQSTGASTSSG